MDSLTDDLAELAGPNLGDVSGRRFLQRARPVVGPRGQRYPSASLAAAAEGVPVETMVHRCRKGYLGWRYADSTHVR